MTISLNRREVLKAGAAFVLGFYLPEPGLRKPCTRGRTFKANAWVRITRDNRITLLTEIPEMGQGTRTANVMMLADELEAEWSSIRVGAGAYQSRNLQALLPAAVAERPPLGSRCEEPERRRGKCS